jgi:hypothetical protein
MILAITNACRGKNCVVVSVECAREYACCSLNQLRAERRFSWYAGPADQLHATQQGFYFQYSCIHLSGVLCGCWSVPGRREALLGIAKIIRVVRTNRAQA